MEQGPNPTNTRNAQGMDGAKEAGIAQEDYGEWMLVNRRRANNKIRNLQNLLEMSHSADPNPM